MYKLQYNYYMQVQITNTIKCDYKNISHYNLCYQLKPFRFFLYFFIKKRKEKSVYLHLALLLDNLLNDRLGTFEDLVNLLTRRGASVSTSNFSQTHTHTYIQPSNLYS